MPYDMTLAAQNTPSKIRVPRQAADRRKFSTARPLANEVVPSRGANTRLIQPMLFVYQERAETFCLIAAALRRGYEAFARWLEA